MSRPLWLVFVPLFGCYQFEGDLGRLGFVSNLIGGAAAWTPEQSIAAGTPAAFAATDILGLEKQPEDPTVTSTARGGAKVFPAHCSGCLGVTGAGGAKSRVGFTVDGVYDEFRVRFEPAAGAELRVDLEGGADRFDVVPDREVTVFVDVVDARGRSLGFSPDEIDIDATGDVSAWMRDGVLVVVGADTMSGSGTIEVSYLGRSLGSHEVGVVGADAIARTERRCLDDSCDSLALATFAEDGTRVLGAYSTFEGRSVDGFGVVSSR